MDPGGIQLSEAPVWEGCNLQATDEGFERSRLLLAARGTGCVLVCGCVSVTVLVFLRFCVCVTVCMYLWCVHEEGRQACLCVGVCVYICLCVTVCL